MLLPRYAPLYGIPGSLFIWKHSGVVKDRVALAIYPRSFVYLPRIVSINTMILGAHDLWYCRAQLLSTPIHLCRSGLSDPSEPFAAFAKLPVLSCRVAVRGDRLSHTLLQIVDFFC